MILLNLSNQNFPNKIALAWMLSFASELSFVEGLTYFCFSVLLLLLLIYVYITIFNLIFQVPMIALTCVYLILQCVLGQSNILFNTRLIFYLTHSCEI